MTKEQLLACLENISIEILNTVGDDFGKDAMDVYQGALSSWRKAILDTPEEGLIPVMLAGLMCTIATTQATMVEVSSGNMVYRRGN